MHFLVNMMIEISCNEDNAIYSYPVLFVLIQFSYICKCIQDTASQAVHVKFNKDIFKCVCRAFRIKKISNNTLIFKAMLMAMFFRFFFFLEIFCNATPEVSWWKRVAYITIHLFPCYLTGFIFFLLITFSGNIHLRVLRFWQRSYESVEKAERPNQGESLAVSFITLPTNLEKYNVGYSVTYD